MRLTNYIRDAFINSVLQDVPQVNYDNKIRQVVMEDFIEQMPKAVREAYSRFPEYFRASSIYINDFGYVSVHCGDKKELTQTTKEKVKELVKQHHEQSKIRSKLKTDLKAVAYSVTTANALRKALPEFEKYLNEYVTKPVDRSVPAIANVVSSFVAAGWPKVKKPQQTEAKKEELAEAL